MIIKTYLETGFVGCDRQEELEVPDDLTDTEIDEIVKDWVDNYIEYGWSKEEQNDKQG